MSLILSGTTGVSDVDGTAATPALRGTDTNTGIFFPAADTIAFAEGGVESMRLDSAGNLGIGTSSPAVKLQVVGGISLSSANNLTWGGAYGAGIPTLTADGTSGFQFYPAGSTSGERMRLDASGNLGLGVTPPASGSRAIYTGFATSGILCMSMGASGGSYGVVGYNTGITNTSGAYNYMIADTASAIRFSSGGFHFLTAPSGTAGNAISFTQAMTLDASGKLGVGVTSPQVELAVYGNSVSRIHVQNAAGGTSTTDGIQFAISGLDGYLWNFENGFLAFGTNNTERARIISSGDLLVGKTSLGSTAGLTLYGQTNTAGYARIDFNKTSSGTFTACEYNHNGTPVGTITYSNTATAYNTSSDYRLKENIQPMTGALAKVQALKPCTYKWKADGSDGEGFIAHELAEVVPQCVTGEKDAVDADGKPVYQGIDTSFLVATLTAAIQELKAELDAVKTELAALKGTA